MADEKEKIITFEVLDDSEEKKRGIPRLGAPISEADKLGLAKGTLIALAIVFVISAVTYGINDQSKAVFETVKQVVPPIVTLILGYYFASKH
jgi:hypothetical protein